VAALSRHHHGCDVRLGASGARPADYSSRFGLFPVPQITSPDKEAAAAHEERNLAKRDRVVARMVTGTAD
jgi:hypothetical protein